MMILGKDGAMIDPDRSIDEVERVIKDFVAFIGFLQGVNQEDESVSDEEKSLADFRCDSALCLADQYLKMKRQFCLCKNDEMLTKAKDIQS